MPCTTTTNNNNDNNNNNLSTKELIQAIQSTLSLPIMMTKMKKKKPILIATGGIMHGQQVYDLLHPQTTNDNNHNNHHGLVISAVMIGSLFLIAKEANTSPAYRMAIQQMASQVMHLRHHNNNNNNSSVTCLTRAFSGRYARGLINEFTRSFDSFNSNNNNNHAILSFPLQNAFTRDIRRIANEQNQWQYLSLWMGQGIDQFPHKLMEEISTKQLIEQLIQEYQQALAISSTISSKLI
jgi:nitronate monooxygenase